MFVFTPDMEAAYAETDAIGGLLETVAEPGDDRFASHRWLRESLPKRLIYHAVYGDLLGGGTAPQRVLDVGGGFTALSRMLLEHHRYEVIDIAAHDDPAAVADLERSVGKPFWQTTDWHDAAAGSWDVVVANDLFPNVDQRLVPFLDAWLPRCRAMRLSLTYHNRPRWYRARRVDGDEILHVMAWTGRQLRAALEPYAASIVDPHLDALVGDGPSLFVNGRQVAFVELRGSGG